MNFNGLRNNLMNALDILITKDCYLLRKDINERSISHKLAQYLADLYSDYDVDCEYNGNVLADSGKKYIFLLKETAEKYGLLLRDEKDDDIVYRNVYPDIIIHKRGFSNHNILIIEMKKSSSVINCDYDIEKLKRYTSPKHGNKLNYSYGVLIYLGVADKFGKDHIEWFENGNRIV